MSGMARRRSLGDISYGLVIGGLALLAAFIIVAPVVIVLATSFTEGQALKFPPKGFSFTWYEQLFDPGKSRQIHRTAGNSLQPGCCKSRFACSTAFSTPNPHGETTNISGAHAAISFHGVRTESAPLRPSASCPPAISIISGTQWPQQ